MLVSFIIVLVLLLTPFAGNIYENIIKHKISSGVLGGISASYYEGFFLSSFFIIPLLLVLFGTRKKYKAILVSLLIFIVVLLVIGAWEQLIISLITALLGWLIGEGILLLYKTLKSNKK